MIDVVTTRTERRGFLHKRIAKFAGKLARTGLGVVGAAGIPGISGAARLTRSFIPGGSRNLRFNRGRAAQIERGATFRRGISLPPGLTPRGPGGLIGLIPGVPGGVTGFQATEIAAQTGECPKGFHKNRTGYHLRSGVFVDPESRCVRNRRRNNDNGRAAMRAARRLLGRKKSQDAIDKALRAFAPRARGRRRLTSGKQGTTIVQN